ncbi:unnamed protein product [Adineta steineri]|uniref:Uncharacterized protein n=1 Tax=Adineta steineri TaxID=433720 RepID=A0A815I314_9BILA|nr:unnamed protein product [Adineta steineri]
MYIKFSTGAALSVLAGNVGSLVGVAISASLLPPAVNAGLLASYSLLSALVPSIGKQSSIIQVHEKVHALSTIAKNCSNFIGNDYTPVYSCRMATDAGLLSICSFVLTMTNIVCIIVVAMIILRIKEVVPIVRDDEIAEFWHNDVRIVRGQNKKIHHHDVSSLVNLWKEIASTNPTSLPNEENNEEVKPIIETKQSKISLRHRDKSDIILRRKLENLQEFANAYNLNLSNTDDVLLLNKNARKNVEHMANDILASIDETNQINLGSFVAQMSGYNRISLTRVRMQTFYQELLDVMPPKWKEVGVAISASLLPPAVNAGLLASYSLLSALVPSIGKQSSIVQVHEKVHALSTIAKNCSNFIGNDYTPVYSCRMATDAGLLSICSFVLTMTNIVCIIVVAMIILRIKEVVPIVRDDEIAEFWHNDVRIVRGQNKKIHHHDVSSLVNLWKEIASTNPTSLPNEENNEEVKPIIETKQSKLPLRHRDKSDIILRRKLKNLQEFANAYNLNLSNTDDVLLLNKNARKNVEHMANDIIASIDETNQINLGSFVAQMSGYNRVSLTRVRMQTFYQELLDVMPPKWKEVFQECQEQSR